MSKYCKIPIEVFEDEKLGVLDIAVLTQLFYLSSGKKGFNLELEKLSKRFTLSNRQIQNILINLRKNNWLSLPMQNINNLSTGSSLYIKITIPEKDNDPYNQAGSKIARAWSKYFSSRMIKHEDVYQLRDYVSNGMEEELVLKIMEYSSKKIKDGRAFNYSKAILFDLYKRGILTVEEYEKEEGGSNEQGFSKNNSSKKARTKRKEFKREKYR
ncbi:MAG: DnaD domain protein [Candidatus Woesearchaeota archaeon]